MYQNYDAALSKTIMFLRFPLIVSVVFIHAGLEGVVIGGNVTVHDGQFPIYESVYHVITNEIARVSVPLFFFISGFLFFSAAKKRKEHDSCQNNRQISSHI